MSQKRQDDIMKQIIDLAKVSARLDERTKKTNDIIKGIDKKLDEDRKLNQIKIEKLGKRTDKLEVKSNLITVVLILTILFIGSTFFDNITDYLKLIIELWR